MRVGAAMCPVGFRGGLGIGSVRGRSSIGPVLCILGA